MDVMKKYKIIPLHFPIDGVYNYNVQEWRSVDGGNNFYYCGFGKYFKTFEECREYIKKEGGENALLYE